jgi:hypothetical protein
MTNSHAMITRCIAPTLSREGAHDTIGDASFLASPPLRMARPHARHAPEPAPHAAPPWAALADDWQKLAQEWSGWWTRAALPLAPDGAPSPAVPAQLAVDPARAASITERYAARFQDLWQRIVLAQGAPPAVVEAPQGDRRFEASAWREQPWFAWLKQSYLLYGRVPARAGGGEHAAAGDKRRLAFMTRQFADAIAPTNFVATNPEVLAEAVRTEGGSLVNGSRTWSPDVGRGRISMSDDSAFAVGATSR